MKSFYSATRFPLHAVLVILVLSAGAARAEVRVPDCFVLSVGVDNYPNVNKLTGCVNDARNTTAAFRAQQGQRFGRVHTLTLVEGEATHANIRQKFQDLSRQGSNGDFVVLFLSGHGGRPNGTIGWHFVPYDYQSRRQAETAFTDREILDDSDRLIRQGRKVVVIIDACFSGQLRITASEYFPRYQSPDGGGLILMLSSSATQTSAALGQFSPFAKAVADALGGSADLNHDGKITLNEITQFSKARTYELLRQHGKNDQQDSEVAWSPSISANLSFAVTRRLAQAQRPLNPVPVQASRLQVWAGNEDLAGFGKLAFTLRPDGLAVMSDAQGSSPGTWRQNGRQLTLLFAGGRVVYTGILQGSELSGTASNAKTSWSWRVSASGVN